jgi:hypothetical protein
MNDMIARLAALADGEDIYTVKNMNRLIRDLGIEREDDLQYVFVTGLTLDILYGICADLDIIQRPLLPPYEVAHD